MSFASKILKLAAACSLAIGSVGTASALSYRLDSVMSPYNFAFPTAVDSQLVAHVDGIADYVSPGVFHISTASGYFTSAFGNGNITGVLDAAIFSNNSDSGNNILLPNDSLNGGVPFAAINGGTGVIGFTTDNPNLVGLAFGNAGTAYFNTYGVLVGSDMQGIGFFAANTTVRAPEIDGGKLPLAALMLGIVALVAQRKRKAMVAA